MCRHSDRIHGRQMRFSHRDWIAQQLKSVMLRGATKYGFVPDFAAQSFTAHHSLSFEFLAKETHGN